VASLRRFLRRYVPRSARTWIAQGRRSLRDRRDGVDRLLTLPTDSSESGVGDFQPRIIVTQRIPPNAHSAGKIVNLRIAAEHISRAVILPDKIFSFWTSVGPPTEKNGFVLGRSIIDDVLSQEVGGGLCQISGLIYEVGLRAGMIIRERHPHTLDLYTEETRFTPLGLDATVAYGFKDVRLQNCLGQPVRFSFVIEDTSITAQLEAAEPLPAWDVVIDCRPSGDSKIVRVSRTGPDHKTTLISENRYALG